MDYTTLITPPQLQACANAVVFDCRFDLADPEAGAAAYAEGHIPGAFYLHLEHDLSGVKTGRNGRHPLPAAETLLEKLRSCGVDNDTQVVAYDAQGGMFAARLWCLLRWLGHISVAVLDGGLPAWQSAGGPMVTALPQARRGQLTQQPCLQPTITADRVRDNLQRPGFLMIDARSGERFRGERETIDPVAGHIPCAANRFFKDNLRDDGHFKPAPQLRQEWLNVPGIDAATPVAHYCGSGVAACHNILALEIAGLNSGALYAGSWSEWCGDAARPVATGVED
ncbi:MAG: sulfurtransferase [Burkholderiaceae bacterium]|nr:MAG: sulfurtransferase [Burkholderiaceae bacterium]